MSLLGKMLGFGRSAHYDRGIRQFDQGLYAEAIESFAQARQSAGERSDPLTIKLSEFYTGEACAHLGHAAMKRGQWERAQDYFTQALTIHPHYADLHFNLALAKRACKQPEAALSALDAALAINPRLAKAHFTKGLLMYEAGKRAQALQSLCEALEIEPGFRTEAFLRAMNYHHEGDFLAALQAFEQVSHTEVDDILFHYKLGDDMYRRAMYAEAAGEYQKALTLNPDYADIRNRLALVYGAQGLVQEAIAEYRYALRINPRYVDALTNLALLLRDNGQTEESHTLLQQALEIDPDNVVAQTHLHGQAQAA